VKDHAFASDDLNEPDSGLVCGAVAGEAERAEDESDGETDRKSAEAVVEVCVMGAELFVEERHREAASETEVADGKDSAGFGCEISSCKTHGGFSFRVSVSEAEPGEQGHLDGDEGESDSEQVPTPDVIPEEAIFKENYRKTGGGDTGNAGGAAAVIQKPFIDKSAEDGNSAKDGMSHDSLSRSKIWSVGQAKMRAKVRASSRLGT
jgi:hypothetical protein